MQYKGDDLDLRVPHARSVRESYSGDYEGLGSNGRWSRPSPAFTGAGGEPLWVDEVVLQVCNYAFDVAQANGSADVGLEHIVNALTRVDPAARILEARGVREGQLRRESAALIASEVPAANAGDAVVPRRSGELEDVLRRACDVAQRRGQPAGVEDLLGVLISYNRDLPVLHLLRRLAPDWPRGEWTRPREAVAAEPMPRPATFFHSDSAPVRMGSVEDSLRQMQSEFSAERKLLMDLVRDIQRDVVAQRGDAASFRGDLGQRLEALERSMLNRPDGSRLQLQVSDRIAALEKMVTSAMTESVRSVRDLGQRLAAFELSLGDGNGSLQNAVLERVAAIERTVHGIAGEQARGGRELGQRLGALETALSESGDGKRDQAIADRMGTLEKAVHSGLGEGARNWAYLGQRLTSLEASLGERHETSRLDVITERLAAVERAIPASLADATRPIGLMAQRLGDIETSLSRVPAGGAVPEALTQRLGSIERLVETLRGEQSRTGNDIVDRMAYLEAQLGEQPSQSGAQVSELAERIGGLERAVRSGFGEAAQTSAKFSERLGLVERSFASHPGDSGEALLILDERLGGIERVLETRGEQSISVVTQVLKRLELLETRPVTASMPDIQGFIGPIGTRLQELETTNLARIGDVQTGLGEIASRLGALEERIKAEAAVTEEALRGRDQDFDFIYNEIKQLGQSQVTLNSAINDWRTESQTNFGTLATRLDALHGLVQAPITAAAAAVRTGAGPAVSVSSEGKAIEVPNGKAAHVEGAKSEIRADDYVLPAEPDRSFWYWLFGTSSLSKANRETELKLAQMRQNIKEARDRRRMEV